MATKKTSAVRFKDPEEKYMGSEPSFNNEEDWPERKIDIMKSFNWYNHFCNRKEFINDLIEYGKTNLKLTKEQIALFKLGGTFYIPTTIGALVRMEERGLILNTYEKKSIGKSILENIQHGKTLLDKFSNKGQMEDATEDVKIEVITPQQRLRSKINKTIMEDFRVMEDTWIGGGVVVLDAYELMKRHDLPSMAVGMITPWVKDRIDEMQGAIDKTCDQAVDGYKHLSKKELTGRVKILNKILDDLKRHQANSKTVRKVRTKKPVAATKLVAKIKFLKESPEFKLVSINPTTIVGAGRLFVFNVKTRILSEYITSGPDGLAVKGTTLQNWDQAKSRSTRLRKPEAFLPTILSKTQRQINNAWENLTTKDTLPNGRLNEETILMRITNG